MEYIDHTTRRIALSIVTGLAVGAITATRRGLPLRNTSFSVAFNWGLVASTLSGTERLSYALLEHLSDGVSEFTLEPVTRLYTSHSIGGFVGGSLLAIAYQKPPFPGGLAFTPVMLAIAWGENTFLEARRAKLKELMEEIQEDDDK
jgi:hypothetical protein